MIPDQVIMFMVMMVLSYIFGERLVPQVAIILLAVIQMLGILTGSSLTTPTEAYYVFLFIVNILYAAGKMLTREDEKAGYLERIKV